MTESHPQISVAIVDFGLGNLFSVKHACARAGMQANITHSRVDILAADVVLLPGIGAFGDAVVALEKLDLIGPLRDIVAADRILVGICLGMQLLMTESFEFGRHSGLGIIDGEVVHFGEVKSAVSSPMASLGQNLKVPQVGWNRIYQPRKGAWENTLLQNMTDGEYMYFVHSYYVRPRDRAVTLATSDYGEVTFCSALRSSCVYGFQFHPERSGPHGLKIYHKIAHMAKERVLNGASL